MPLYEYECEACGNRFERIQKFSDPLVDTCPVCSGHVKKLLSSPAIQFKGSGWYITDYAKKSSTEAGKGGNTKSDSSATSSSDPASSGTSKTDTSKTDSSKTDASKTSAKKD